MGNRFTPQEITAAKLESRKAFHAVRHMNRQRVCYAKPAVGHMPFDGHRTVAQIEQERAIGSDLLRLSREASNG